MKLNQFGENRLVRDPKIAVQLLQKQETVFLYSSNQLEVMKLVEETRKRLKTENEKIMAVNQQIIITNPTFFDAIDECLSVRVAEMSGYTFEKAAGILACYGWDTDVLSKPVSMRLSKKALESLIRLGSFVRSEESGPQLVKKRKTK